MNELQSLAEALHHLGAKTCMNRRRQMTVASKIPDTSHFAISFWVTYDRSCWYLGTWGDKVYQVDRTISIHELCMFLLNSDDKRIMTEIPSEMAATYALRELTETERYALWRQMYHSAESEPPEVAFELFITQLHIRGFVVRRNGYRSVLIETPRSRVGTVRRLWFTIYHNHWYVRTSESRIYGLDDISIIEFAFEALTRESSAMEQIHNDLIRAYGMFEVSDEHRSAIEDHACFSE